MNNLSKSQITGKGYGDSHLWRRGQTFIARGILTKGTVWSCPCGEAFVHRYDLIPDIFVAMKVALVSEKCSYSSEREND